MSLKRSLKRKHEVSRKKALKKGLKRAINAATGMPTTCSTCSKKFTEGADLDKWFVNLSDNTVRLICPECSEENT